MAPNVPVLIQDYLDSQSNKRKKKGEKKGGKKKKSGIPSKHKMLLLACMLKDSYLVSDQIIDTRNDLGFPRSR